MKRILLLLALTGISTVSFAQTIDYHIKVDQFGYRAGDTKVAIISQAINGYNAPDSYTPGSSFKIVNEFGTQQSLSTPVAWNGGNTHTQSGDKVWWLDFSTINTPGKYYILDVNNNIRSAEFEIKDDVYRNVLKHACRMFFYQRCNIAKTFPAADPRWTDGAAHRQDTACRSVTDQNNAATAKDLSGGWFDAGDFNKYVNFAHTPVHQLLDAYDENPQPFTDDFNIPESGNGIPDILDELKWELDWLLKMQLSNGSVLSKVSTLQHLSASPASADNNKRYYGAASASATRSVASMFAHASLVFRKPNIPALNVYADTLLARAVKAWNWVNANPATSSYNNVGFESANPEQSAYFQNATRTCGAVYLYAATGIAAYKTYFESNYTSLQPYSWGYWYPYEPVYQSAMLYYTKLSGITASVKTNILNNCKNAVNSGNADLLTAYNNKTDAYRAQLADNDYVWGSSQVKCNMGTLFSDMWVYGVDPSNDASYRIAAEDYIHYMHGTNAIGKSMLSNMYGEGADNSINEIYHAWFGDGTIYDNAKTSPNGPPHGYVTGGVNKSYAPDGSYSGPAISPPQNQPVQKCYKDWNTSWPENSWEISEPAIYYQAAYIKLLSKFTYAEPFRCSFTGEHQYKNTTGITQTSAKFHWRELTPQTQYRYCEGYTNNWTTPVTTTDTFGIATGLTPNTMYRWVTRYICGIGDTSYWVDTIQFTTLPAAVPCSVPDSIRVSDESSSSTKVSWKPVGTASYQFRWRVDGNPGWTYSTTSNSYEFITGLTPPVTVIFEVRTICGTGDTSAWSPSRSYVFTGPPPSCVSPDSLWVTDVTDTSATLHWSGGVTETHYVVAVGFPAGNQYFNETGTSLNIGPLEPGTTYGWSVFSYCNGLNAASRDSLSFTTTSTSADCPEVDTVYVGNLTDSSAYVYWDKVAEAIAYRITYGETPNGPFTDTSVSDTSIFIHGLIAGHHYTVWVGTLCANDTSNHRTETHLYNFGCTVPDSITVTVTDTSAMLSWENTNAGVYYITYKADGGSPESNSTITTSIVLSPLLAGTHYTFYFNVACENGTTYGGPDHDFTTHGSADCTDVVDSITVNDITDTSAHFSWDAVAGASGYLFTWQMDSTGLSDSMIVNVANADLWGLLPNGDYSIHVYVICGNGKVASVSQTTRFRTTNKVGLDESNPLTFYRIFPNPTCDKISVFSQMKLREIRILDITGKQIMTLNSPKAQNEISLPLAKGFYLIQLITTTGEQTITKVLKD